MCLLHVLGGIDAHVCRDGGVCWGFMFAGLRLTTPAAWPPASDPPLLPLLQTRVAQL